MSGTSQLHKESNFCSYFGSRLINTVGLTHFFTFFSPLYIFWWGLKISGGWKSKIHNEVVMSNNLPPFYHFFTYHHKIKSSWKIIKLALKLNIKTVSFINHCFKNSNLKSAFFQVKDYNIEKWSKIAYNLAVLFFYPNCIELWWTGTVNRTTVAPCNMKNTHLNDAKEEIQAYNM